AAAGDRVVSDDVLLAADDFNARVDLAERVVLELVSPGAGNAGVGVEPIGGVGDRQPVELVAVGVDQLEPAGAEGASARTATVGGALVGIPDDDAPGVGAGVDDDEAVGA